MSRPASATTDVPSDRVISMSELQKLSLRKLREMRLEDAPLVVRDLKRRQGRFVVLDHRGYERLVRCAGAAASGTRFPGEVDFASFGLFWDRPEMTNERFSEILADPASDEHDWAWARVLSRLPSRVVTRRIGLSELRERISTVKLRPRIREAWEGAVEFWTAEARRRLA